MKVNTFPVLMMVATIFFAISLPVKTQASDWKEYVLVEESDGETVVYRERNGDGTVSFMEGRIVVVVNQLIKVGWQPLGGVSSDHKGRLFQVMVRK